MEATEIQNEFEVSKKMEDEHLRLQRQVRMTQTDRLHRTMGVHPKFRRQDLLLRTLKKEYLNLHKNLKIARSGAHKKNDKKMKSSLKRALLQRTQTVDEEQEGMMLMDQIEELLHRKNRHILELHNKVTTHSGKLEERRSLSENRLSSTENRLEAAICRFNVVQCENRKIRSEIEHILKDRAIFNQAWNRMQSALNRGKKYLSELFESSALAYDQRDEWCSKLRSVREKGRLDQMVQVHEMKDLQKAFDHEMKLYNFLAKKGVIRKNMIEEQRQETITQKEEENINKEQELHSKTINEIYEYTQEHEINKIIERFERVEQENWSLYELLTQHCAECEVLRRNVARVHTDIEDRRDWNEKKYELGQMKIQQLKEELKVQKKKTEIKRNKLAEADKLLDNTMDKVNVLFNTLDCSLQPFENLLGDKQPSLHRLHLTFGLITEEIKELVQVTYYYERYMQKKTDAQSSRLKRYTVHPEHAHSCSALAIGLLVPADTCPVCVEARWVSRVTEDSEAPFTTAQTLSALSELARDPAFVRSDRVHALADCRMPASRANEKYINDHIHKEIEHILKDRAIFNQAWNRMQSALNRGKKYLSELFESSALAYDQRDEWCSKLRSVREKGRLDQMVQVHEMKDLQKAFDHEMKLYNFLAKKGVIRKNMIEEQRQETITQKEEENINKEQELHSKTINEIYEYTQEHEINKIIERFERVEQENWSLYELLTQHCAECEVLRRNVARVHTDIEDRRDWNEKKYELGQMKIQQLKEELKVQKKKTEIKRNKLAEADKLLDNTMDKVNVLFNTLDCSLQPFENLLGDKQPSLHRLHLTFGLITEEIKELVQVTYYYERYMQKKTDAQSSRLKRYTVHPEHAHSCSALAIGLLVPADTCPVCVEARWVSRVTEDSEAPFTTAQTLSALSELARDPAFVRSDRVHALADCRMPASRAVLARRYIQ